MSNIDPQSFRTLLCQELSTWDMVCGVAQTGDVNAPLVPGKSDVDLFVLCEKVPTREEREKWYRNLGKECDSLMMEVCNDDIWGCGDIFVVNEIDIMPMFFSKEKFVAYVEEILSGKYLYAQGRFYPIGRLASVESIHVFYEKDHAWTSLIARVKEHPKDLFENWFRAQNEMILDEEDLSRVILRKEVLFYHQVLEAALDHFLQALYALNDCYFPSRKRSEQAIDGFQRKPQNCKERLLEIVRNATSSETIEKSVEELRNLTKELRELKI